MLKGVLDKFRFYWIEIKVHGLGYYGKEGSGGGTGELVIDFLGGEGV